MKKYYVVFRSLGCCYIRWGLTNHGIRPVIGGGGLPPQRFDSFEEACELADRVPGSEVLEFVEEPAEVSVEAVSADYW